MFHVVDQRHDTRQTDESVTGPGSIDEVSGDDLGLVARHAVRGQDNGRQSPRRGGRYLHWPHLLPRREYPRLGGDNIADFWRGPLQPVRSCRQVIPDSWPGALGPMLFHVHQ
jgi:hypothetical protein